METPRHPTPSRVPLIGAQRRKGFKGVRRAPEFMRVNRRDKSTL